MSKTAHGPTPLSNFDFGERGMSAALNMTDDEFLVAYMNKEIAPPDSVRSGESRWSIWALAREITKRTPAGLAGLEILVYHINALVRAEQAEEGHDDAPPPLNVQ
ncbi:hypothetical protein [Magnetospirillum aberrantis]|uniref:Uncharacterized protein n=1 Tax=Magnetospirillum aberrantis SpK TaxID=908842 RepID=A0A7C9UYL5_9PROT|nr:hypothetical protein [Magnetospirillum aberrantis]NFV82109.1 hypothetical protein [Magnetospirillum aberrantis SpK]